MKSVKFYKENDTVRVISIDTETLTEVLEPAVYTLGRDMFGGYFLTFKSKKFQVPERIYGSTVQRAEKVIKTYESRSLSTGLLLTGDKGAGKTMLSSYICNKMIDKGLPVILIEDTHYGPGFNQVMEDIGEAVLFFDEFGKIFKERKDEENPQDKLLSIFDGTSSRKRLIILTENKEGLINEYMKNRPGRIYYHFKYKKIEEQVIKEYAADHGVPENIIEEICLRCQKSYEFSFDVLKAIVEEYGRYNGNIEEICEDLNIEQPESQNLEMEIISVFDTKEQKEFMIDPFDKKVIAPTGYRASHITYINGKDSDGENNYESVSINIKDLVKRSDKKVMYRKNDIVIVAQEILPQVYTYHTAHAF